MRPHPDVDLLALHALGEPALGEAERRHVSGCPACARTVAELAETVRIVRGPEVDETTPVPVPAHVWQGIAAELDLQPSVRPASVGPSAVRVPQMSGGPAGHEAPADLPSAAGPAGPGRGLDPDVRPVAGGGGARTGHPALRLLAVAAAGLVVGAAGTVAVGQLRDGAGTGAGTVVAATELTEFGAGEGSGLTGSARLTSGTAAGGGTVEDRVLELRLDRLPDPGEDFLEAWLIDPDTGAMVSLGPVPTPEAGAATVELAVPRGLDVATFALVDVSSEPLDGDPTHSGASLARGTLGT